jgi:predicted TIM-barrel fold metal-dependent hydrolase
MSDQHFRPVVDADGHVLEPGDMYQTYIDPQYRDRAIRIEVDAKGYENLIIDNKPYQSETMRGNLGAIGGIGMDRKKLLTRGMVTYAEGSPAGGYDPNARLKVMDEEEIDLAILYPTLGIFWEGAVQDPQLATAYTRAYNRWIVDFCRENPKRLYPVAHISLLDPDGAVEETLRARKAGCVGVYLSPDLPARKCVVSADPDETMIAPVVNHLGADYFIWASDYPHIDASFGVVKEMKERVASLPLADQRKVLGENAVRFYNL